MGRENQIITNYELFAELLEGVFGRMSKSKILDQKMPITAGLQAAEKILMINPKQRIVFAKGYLERTLLEVLTKLNKAIAVIEKPFSLEVLDHMVNTPNIFEKLEKININQQEKDISKRMSEIMIVLQNQV